MQPQSILFAAVASTLLAFSALCQRAPWLVGPDACLAVAQAPDLPAVEAAAAAPWRAASPLFPWLGETMRAIEARPLTNPRHARVFAMVTMAAADAWSLASSGHGTVASPRVRAVTAGAAFAVLAATWPENRAALEQLAAADLAADDGADRAAWLTQFAFGQSVGCRVFETAGEGATNDAPSVVAPWTTQPQWVGMFPIEPAAGNWTTFLVGDVQELLPPPPPEFGGAARAAELAELHAAPRTAPQQQRARYWQTLRGIFWPWYELAEREVQRGHLGVDAQLQLWASMAVAHHDACVACWYAKYHYLTPRAFQVDPTLTTLFPTPNHPSYPAGHSTLSAAIAEVTAALLPAAADEVRALAAEASESRLWAGVHWRSDLVAGNELGRAVATRVLAEQTEAKRNAGGRTSGSDR